MDRAIEAVPASPDYVFEALRDSHRHQCSYDPEADPQSNCSSEPSVRVASRMRPRRNEKLAEALNEIWGLTMLRSEWEARARAGKAAYAT